MMPMGYRSEVAVPLDREPACELTKQWDGTRGEAYVANYAGSDGYLYELITPVNRPSLWMRVGVGRLPTS
jgi:hypothetical protein